MEAFSFGSYYPGDSAIHRLDPRTKLLLALCFNHDADRRRLPRTGSCRNFRRADLCRVPGAGSSRSVVDGAAAGNRRRGRGAQLVYRSEWAHPVAARLSADKRGSLRSAAFMACRLT